MKEEEKSTVVFSVWNINTEGEEGGGRKKEKKKFKFCFS